MSKKLILTLLLIITASGICATNVSKLALPWVFPGYRSLSRQWLPDSTIHLTETMWRIAGDSIKAQQEAELMKRLRDMGVKVTEPVTEGPEAITDLDSVSLEDAIPSYRQEEKPVDYENPTGLKEPEWLREAIRERSVANDFMYRLMVEQPHYIQYAEWDLPVPPTLPEQDHSFMGYIRSLNLPDVDMDEVETERKGEVGRINWLHVLNGSLQLSQAYISHNWYQGGNDYLAFFGNFLWDVQLNQVYNPRIMFQSTLNYKLAITSTAEDKYHKYQVSQELFQYNIKFGYQAKRRWYYSINGLFKTQFLNSYPANSESLKAGFLSPGTLNLGLGMTYSYEKPNKKLSFSASIAPLSYNMKTCLNDRIDRASLGMKDGQNILHEYGSNTEVNFFVAFRDNISYKSRLFLFTDYKNFTGDWENTINFQFSKYFSTQLYFYFRYDSATDSKVDPGWKKWMLKEILSVGLSYTFSTK